jgi:tetratricopeptide (TPR) repeat protein
MRTSQKPSGPLAASGHGSPSEEKVPSRRALSSGRQNSRRHHYHKRSRKNAARRSKSRRLAGDKPIAPCETVSVIFRRVCAWLGTALTLALVLDPSVGCAAAASGNALDQRWLETRTAHFQVIGSGATQEVARLAGRLEQFHQAYSFLAGTQAVATPPVIVIAFPDHESLEPFLPLYQGQPANLGGYFRRGWDANVIALQVAGVGRDSLETIYHEYTHLLFRRNGRVWPLWLMEGMADFYSTFEVTGGQSIRIGKPINRYLELLRQQPLMPLEQLFAAEQDSPEYNEGDRQKTFYAQSWLLTHYLVLGNGNHKGRFGQLTSLLWLGQSPTQAFTNALRVPLSTMQKELQAYLALGTYQSLTLAVQGNLHAPRAFATRVLKREEVCYRLGDLLMRVGRTKDAEAWFGRAREESPSSPVGFEGLGILASRSRQPDLAIDYLSQAFVRRSSNYLAHYVYASEKFRPEGRGSSPGGTRQKSDSEDIQSHLRSSIALMPAFGAAHYLLGRACLEAGQLDLAERHLRRATELEPENPGYPISLAAVQLARDDVPGARRTLQGLLLHPLPRNLRTRAEEMLAALKEPGGSPNPAR